MGEGERETDRIGGREGGRGTDIIAGKQNVAIKARMKALSGWSAMPQR